MKCEKAGGLIAKSDTEKLSIKEKTLLKIHLMNCKICSKWNEFNSRFKKILLPNAKSEVLKLSEEEKKNIKECLNK